MAQRVMAVKRGQATTIPAGNIDVRRDLTDVRDVVVAYRLLLEAAARGRARRIACTVVNVASGDVVTVRVGDRAAVRSRRRGPRDRDRPVLVRADDPAEIRGDATLIRQLVGWQPCIALQQTLTDVLGES